MNQLFIDAKTLEQKVEKVHKYAINKAHKLGKWIDKDINLCVDFKYPNEIMFVRVGDLAEDMIELVHNIKESDNIPEVIAKELRFETTEPDGEVIQMTAEHMIEYQNRTGLLTEYIKYGVYTVVNGYLGAYPLPLDKMSEQEIETMHYLFEKCERAIKIIENTNDITSPEFNKSVSYIIDLVTVIVEDYNGDKSNLEVLKEVTL